MGEKKKRLYGSIAIAVIVIYFCVIVSSCTDEEGKLSLLSVMRNLPIRLERPIFFSVNKYTLPALGYGLLLGPFLGCYYYFSRKNWMIDIEGGSARWGDVREISEKLTRIPKEGSKSDFPYERILSEHLRMNLSDKITDLNNNMLLIAAPGKGKTFRMIKPNVLCCNGSMLITDPKKEILRDTGMYLKKAGYEIKVIDLIDFELSDSYNPFAHIRSIDKIPELVETLWSALEDSKSQKGEQIWDDSAKSLVEGLIYYIFMEMEPEKRTFRTLVELITDLSANEKGVKNMNKTMQALRQNDPIHPAAVKYFFAMNGAENTVKSVLFATSSKIAKLSNEKLLKIFDSDSLNFESFGMGYKDNKTKPTALFFCIRDGDKRWNFVVSMAFMQAFDDLYYAADSYCADTNGKLPIPVSCYMDEFANVPLPEKFPSLLQTMRGRNINAVITLQSLSQLKEIYSEKIANTIIDSCDVIVYMGSNSVETHEYFSKMIGKTTIHKRSNSKSYGSHGSESSTVDIQSRDLMTPDEVARLKKTEQLVFVSEEYAVKDKKYSTLQDSRFKEAISLGKYKHVPARVENKNVQKVENKNADLSDEVGGKTQEFVMEAISQEEKERLLKEGASLTQIDMCEGADSKVNLPPLSDKDITIKLNEFSKEQQELINNTYLAGLMSYETMLSLFIPKFEVSFMKAIIDEFAGIKKE